jgi:hypothetical protein
MQRMLIAQRGAFTIGRYLKIALGIIFGDAKANLLRPRS